MELQASVIGAAASDAGSERDLVERAKRDRQAFGQLYRSHHPAITGYIGRRVGDSHVAEDLAAEVFVIALRHLPRYRYRGIPIRVWLYRIASNSVNRWARRNRKVLLQAFDEHTSAMPETTEPEASPQTVRMALLALQPKHQTVLALHYLEGMPLEQVSQSVGCRLGTVKSRLSRGRRALREQLLRGR